VSVVLFVALPVALIVTHTMRSHALLEAGVV